MVDSAADLENDPQLSSAAAALLLPARALTRGPGFSLLTPFFPARGKFNIKLAVQTRLCNS